MKIKELDHKLNSENQERIQKSLSQIPRFIEELTQVQETLKAASEISKEHPDEVIRKVREIYKAISLSRISLLKNLPLGILKPNEFKTSEPIY